MVSQKQVLLVELVPRVGSCVRALAPRIGGTGVGRSKTKDLRPLSRRAAAIQGIEMQADKKSAAMARALSGRSGK